MKGVAKQRKLCSGKRLVPAYVAMVIRRKSSGMRWQERSRSSADSAESPR